MSKTPRASDPNDPAYRWPQGGCCDIDAAIRAGAASGIRIAVMIRATPAWANRSQGANTAPDHDADYARFVLAAARRYPAVRMWMTWGETDSRLTFNPLPDDSPVGPRRYARLLDAAYARLKRQNPANIVIGGMTHNLGQVRNVDFIRFLRLPNGRPPRMDWWGHNAFGDRFPDISRTSAFAGRYDLTAWTRSPVG